MPPQPGDAMCPAWAGAVPLGLPSGIPAPTPLPFTLTSSMPGSSGSSALRGGQGGAQGPPKPCPRLVGEGGRHAPASTGASPEIPAVTPAQWGLGCAGGVDRGILPSRCRDRDQGPGAGSERECGHETLGGSGKASWRRWEESEERQKGKGGHSRERGNSVGNH